METAGGCTSVGRFRLMILGFPVELPGFRSRCWPRKGTRGTGGYKRHDPGQGSPHVLQEQRQGLEPDLISASLRLRVRFRITSWQTGNRPYLGKSLVSLVPLVANRSVGRLAMEYNPNYPVMRSGNGSRGDAEARRGNKERFNLRASAGVKITGFATIPDPPACVPCASSGQSESANHAMDTSVLSPSRSGSS